MFSCFYHARQKIALISGAKRMEIRTMATLGSLVIHHWVIFPSLLLIQNTLGVGEGGGGGGACEQCGDKCAGHYLRSEEHHDFYQPHGRQGMKIKPSSEVIAEARKKAERKGCNLSGKEKLALAKETLLTEEDVEMWLQHLSDVSNRRKERAKKPAATRRHKNKGHTEEGAKGK